MHTCHLFVVVLVVVTPGPGGFLRTVQAHQCSPQTYISSRNESAVIDTVTHSNDNGFLTTLVSTNDYVRPQDGFRGVGIVMKTSKRAFELGENVDGVWFAMEAACFPGKDDWYKVWTMAWLENYSDSYLLQCFLKQKFEVRTSGCVKLCSTSGTFRSITSVQVLGVGTSKWRNGRTDTPRCGIISNTKNDTYSDDEFPDCVNLLLRRSSSRRPTNTTTTTTTKSTAVSTLGIAVVVVVLVVAGIYLVWRWCLEGVITCMLVRRQIADGV